MGNSGVSNLTVVICIGDRFFFKFGKGHSVQTAWSLGGALLFQHGCNNNFQAILDELILKGKNPVVRSVLLGGAL